MLLAQVIKSVFIKKQKQPVFLKRNGEKRFNNPIVNNTAPKLVSEEKSFTVKSSEKFNISLGLSNRTIIADSNKTIIENAQENNIDMKFSCAIGGCGSCKVRVTKGKVNMKSPNCLSQPEFENGYILACVSYPTEDLVLEA